MEDLSILHLSDLHIEGGRDSYSRLLRELIADVKQQVINIEKGKLIIVVTGDIIHKGNNLATEPAFRFFKDLKDAVADKARKIYIVPGNHDKKRTDESKFLIDGYRSMYRRAIKKEDNEDEYFGEIFFTNFWKYHIESYKAEKGSGYFELTKKIYELFGINENEMENLPYINDTFGVDTVTIDGTQHRFVLLNTSWSCIDDFDNRNMLFGKFQLEKIRQQFDKEQEKIENKNRGLTLILGHHPLDSLFGEEEDNLFANMISFESLDADAYICGHTHDKEIINWSNSRHTIHTLVSGIGWPESTGSAKSKHVGDHTYSIYTFNLDINSIEICVRATNYNGKFVPETKMNTTDNKNGDERVIYPIRSEQAQAYFSLSTIEKEKIYFISSDILRFSKEFSLHMWQFCVRMHEEFNDSKNDIYDDFMIEDVVITSDEKGYENADCETDKDLYFYLFSREEQEEMPNSIKKYFELHKLTINFLFLGFLQKLCSKIIEIFLDEEMKKIGVVRAHFRYLADKKDLLYKKLCMSFNCGEVSYENNDVSEMKFGDLLKWSFKLEKGLIYNVNERFCNNKLKNKWANFITIVPIFTENKYIINKKNETNRKEYPYITFGITISNKQFNRLLYCMDFFSIKNAIEKLIGQYVSFYSINLSDFCDWANEHIERENE